MQNGSRGDGLASNIMPLLPSKAWIGPFEPPVIELGGPFFLSPFGLLAALGFWVGFRVARSRAKSLFLDTRLLPDVVFLLFVGAVVGGHLGHALFYEPERYFARPIEFLYLWQGLSSTGGFVACIGLTAWFLRRRGKSFLEYGDVLAYAFPFGFVFGRIGCFLVGDHPGKVTDFPLGVYGIHPMPKVLCFVEGVDPGSRDLSEACRALVETTALHDLGLYEAIFVGMLALAFRHLGSTFRSRGFFLGWLALSYGCVRFFLDFLRSEYGPDVRRSLGGLPALTPAQYFCFVLFCVGFWTLCKDWSLKEDAQRVPKGHRSPE